MHCIAFYFNGVERGDIEEKLLIHPSMTEELVAQMGSFSNCLYLRGAMKKYTSERKLRNTVKNNFNIWKELGIQSQLYFVSDQNDHSVSMVLKMYWRNKHAILSFLVVF